MFGKSFRENPKPENPSVPELKLPENFTIDNNSTKEPKPFTEESVKKATTPIETEITEIIEVDKIKSSELVDTVERISGIVSPYFIAIAGLTLYDDNFFLGTILITVGILSLLKIDAQDVAIFFEWLKAFLGFGNDDEVV